jgi:hypothetical protein
MAANRAHEEDVFFQTLIKIRTNLGQKSPRSGADPDNSIKQMALSLEHQILINAMSSA